MLLIIHYSFNYLYYVYVGIKKCFYTSYLMSVKYNPSGGAINFMYLCPLSRYITSSLFDSTYGFSKSLRSYSFVNLC